MRFIEWLLCFLKRAPEKKKILSAKNNKQDYQKSKETCEDFSVVHKKMLSEEELIHIGEIVIEIVEKASQIIDAHSNNIKMAKTYHEIFMEALGEIMNVYDKPKPCTDFEATIEAWKRDRPTQLSSPDNLVAPRFYLKNENN